ncbi:MAG: alanine racemase [Candidatus Neomarinimicrobiota bacterium]|nr:alanine racemase [Candidatus Neomarinimicrobiota bacterium]
MLGPKVVIHIDRLLANYDLIKNQLNNNRLMVVVKANAYGHGSVECARALEKHGCDSFAVFSVHEGIELRKNGIDSDILVFSKINDSYLDLADKYRLTLNVSNLLDISLLESFRIKHGKSPKFHLKFDTGMTRLGINPSDAKEAFELISKDLQRSCEGIYSHFATADEGDLSYAYEQLSKFKEILNMANSLGIKFETIHFSNSGAALNIDQSEFDQVRVGMIIYGAFPSNEVPMNISILPVMEFRAPIVEVRSVDKDTQISYGGVYKTDAKSNIGVIQCGFADGVPRSWHQKGYVSYNGKQYKIAGRICMDQFMVNFENDMPRLGEEVLIFGANNTDSIRMETIAETIDSTPYVIATDIKGRTQREYNS